MKVLFFVTSSYISQINELKDWGSLRLWNETQIRLEYDVRRNGEDNEEYEADNENKNQWWCHIDIDNNDDLNQ